MYKLKEKNQMQDKENQLIFIRSVNLKNVKSFQIANSN